MAIANNKDLTHVVRTTQQWQSSYDKYECIPEGVLCIEFTTSGQALAKIGNGRDIFSKLPYIGGADLTNYYTKSETAKCVEEIIKANRFIRIKGILQNKDQLPSHADCGDLYFVISQNQSSSNKYDEYVYSPSNTWENLGSIPIDIDLSEYAKIVYVDEKIDEVNERIDDIEQHGTHTHANKDILDLITAAFTAEEKDKLSTLYNYDDTELRELITQASHTHSNKDILDAISAPFTKEDKSKLDQLNPYDDSVLKEKITALERLAHEHSNKRILDRTTASFTTEYERKMRWIRLYTGCTGMEEGIAGLVPAAQAGEEDYVLSGSGEWVPQTGGGGTYELPIATASTLGGIKVGDGLEIDANGKLSIVGGGGGGDSIAEGNGITITTDPQTGVKTISVNTGDHLEVDENTGELNVTDVDYEAGHGIHIGSNYNFLEYIKNSGNYDQIILTDILPKFSDTLEVDVMFGAASGLDSNREFIGTCNYDGASTVGDPFFYGIYVFNDNIRTSNITFYNHFVWTPQCTNTNFIDNPYGIDYYGNNPVRQIARMQGSTGSWGNVSRDFSDQYRSDFVDPFYPMAIFGSNHNNNVLYQYICGEITLYGVKLYDSLGTLIHDLRPVERVSDNAAGLYDVLTNKFYGNAGGGSFVKGPIITTPDRIINAKIGNGLQFDSNNAIEVNTGDGLQINQDGELEIDPSIIPEVPEYSAGEAITIRDVSSILPAGYVEVDYIEGVGNYTVIDYIPNRKTKIVGTASQTQTSYDPVLFGNRTGSNGQQFVFWFNGYDSTQAKAGFVYGTNTWSTSSDCDDGKLIPYTLEDQFTFLISLDDEFNINDSFVHNITENGAPASNLKLGIFALVSNSSDEIESSDQIFRGRIYEFKIYEDDELVVNLIPAISTSTNQGGFYDAINDIFYTSKTATSFGYDSSTIHSTGKVIDVNYGNGLTVNQNNELEINTGDGLSVNANNEVELSKATANSLGGIKVGSGFVYTSDGLLNATPAAPPFDAGDGLELIYDDIDALPNGYGHVDYVCSNPENNLINANGRARTLIDYIPTNTTKLAIKMQRDSERQDLCFVGSRIASRDHEFCFWNEYDSTTELAFSYGSTNYSNAYVTYSSYLTGQIIEVECIIGDTSNTLSVNGTAVKTYTKSGDASPYKLGIFQAYLNESWSHQPANGKIYYIKLYEGDTLAVNLIPAVRLVDEAVGFYDNVNDKFYTSLTDYPFTTDMSTIVVDGAQRTLNVKYNNGLMLNQNNELEVNIGTGLEFDQVTGAINVTGGSGGDTVEAGDGIDIDTDSQTGNKVISVDTGNGLQINQDGEVEIDPSIIPDSYEAGDAIEITEVTHGDEFRVQNQEYFFDTRGLTCGLNARVWTTVNDGDILAAMCIHNNGGNQVPLFVGVTEDSVKVSQNYDSTILGPNGSFDYRGKTWYFTADYALSGTDGQDTQGHIQTLPTTYSFNSTPSNFVPAAKDLIDLAVLLSDLEYPVISVKYKEGLTLNQYGELAVNVGNGLYIDTSAIDPTTFNVQNQEYFFNTTNVTATIDGTYGPRSFVKLYADDCLFALCNQNNYNTPILVGLTADSVKIRVDGNYGTSSYGPSITFDYRGKTWYCTSGYGLSGGTMIDQTGTLQVLPTVYSVSAEADYEIIGKDLIDAAILLPSPDITTVNAKIGAGLSFDANGAIQADAQPLSPATDSTLGGVIVGDGILVDNDGTISVDPSIIPEVIEYEGGTAILVVDNSNPYINKVRWTISDIRGTSDSWIQMRYFGFYNENQERLAIQSGLGEWSDDSTVTYYQHRTLSAMINNQYEMTASLWDGTKSFILTFNLPVGTRLNDLKYFRYQTGDDETHRDPVSWEIHAYSEELDAWLLLNTETNATIPTGRDTWTDYFDLEYVPTETIDAWNSGTGWGNFAYTSGDSDSTSGWNRCVHSPVSSINTLFPVLSTKIKVIARDQNDGLLSVRIELHTSAGRHYGCYEYSQDEEIIDLKEFCELHSVDVPAYVSLGLCTLVNPNYASISPSNVSRVDIIWYTDIVSPTKDINVKYGNGLTVNQNNELEVEIPPATETDLGGIKIGSGFTYLIDGTLNANPAMPPFEIGDALELLYDDPDALPTGYAHVDYISSNPATNSTSSTNYGRARTLIDYTPENVTKLEIKMARDNDYQDSCFVGCRTAGSANQFVLWHENRSPDMQVAFVYGSKGYNDARVNVSYVTGQVQEIEANIPPAGTSGNITVLVNGNVVKTYAKSGSPLAYKLGIFQSNRANEWEYQISNGRIYYLRLYEGNTLAVNLIPAVRLVDEVVGFYDNVNDKFYTSLTDYPFTTDMSTIVVDGAQRTLNVKYNNGLMLNQNNELEVNIGTGLEFDQVTGAINVIDGGGSSEEGNLIVEGDGIEINSLSFNIPKNYAGISYIEGNGQQWTQLDYTITHDTRVVIEMSSYETETTSRAIFGSRRSENPQFVTWLTAINGSDYIKTAFVYGSNEYDHYYDTTVRRGTRFTLDASVNGLYINNTLIQSITDQGTMPTDKLGLFAIANGDGTYETSKGMGKYRIFSVKIYDGNSLEMDLVPLLYLDYEHTAKIPGLYDLINETFYSSLTSTDFVYDASSIIYPVYEVSAKLGNGLQFDSNGAIEVTGGSGGGNSGNYIEGEAIEFKEGASRLPTGYTELENISNVSASYIDTGYIPNTDTQLSIIANIHRGTTSWQTLFGARDAVNPGGTEYAFFVRLNDNYNFYPRITGDQYTYMPNQTYDEKIRIDINNTTATVTRQDGSSYSYTQTGSLSNLSTTLAIFALHNQTGYVDNGIIDLYSFKIYENNTIVKDFVPCKRNSDDAIGLIDIINNVFYTNLGTGTFTAGRILTNTSINVKYGTGLSVDPITNELFVDGQLPEGTIIKKLTYVGNGEANNIIHFSKKPLGILALYGQAGGTAKGCAVPTVIDAACLLCAWGSYTQSTTERGGVVSCLMSYNDSTNELTLSQGMDVGSIFNISGETYTMFYLTKGHTGSGTSVNNEVSVIKTMTYIGDGTGTIDIQFSETPDMIVSIYGPTSDGFIASSPVPITSTSIAGIYEYGSASRYGGVVSCGMSFNDSTNILTLSGGVDAGARFNISGATYTVTYSVNEVISTTMPYAAGEAISIETIGGLQPTNYSNDDFVTSITHINAGTIVKAADNSSFTLTATYDDCYTQGSSGQSNGSYPYNVKASTKYRFAWDSANPDKYGIVYVFENGQYGDMMHTANQQDTSYIEFTTTAQTSYIQARFGVDYAGNSITYSNVRLYEVIEDEDQYDEISVKYNKGLSVNQNNELEVNIGAGLAFDPQTGAINVTESYEILWSGSTSCTARSSTDITLSTAIAANEYRFIKVVWNCGSYTGVSEIRADTLNITNNVVSASDATTINIIQFTISSDGTKLTVGPGTTAITVIQIIGVYPI